MPYATICKIVKRGKQVNRAKVKNGKDGAEISEEEAHRPGDEDDRLARFIFRS